MIADTLTYNAKQVAEWQESGDYDYNRELIGSQRNLLEWLFEKINDWLSDLFSGVSHKTEMTLYIIGGILLLLLLSWIIYKVKPRLFRREEEPVLDYTEVEDTIYGIDFSKEIADAKERGDWFEAVRLVYLDTLKHISDTGRITWQPWKTPMQYTYEMNDEALGCMTNLFVRVRYGKYEASESDVTDMEAWRESLQSAVMPAGEKGGEDE
ncbi:MAG: DUF4129 domain-containing protein [Prevotella sp.]|uniref:DUF4129 domain-containing protein n=1 Tax=Prevotella sp. TaxID=59823 RepID=UPI002A25D441|nr:DUF4129 domain-containing protein [Prevotella sp.]MDD7317564.1 DUF4129 domain-containing protein [Prevotellaceae bacterium]MDY4020589.1 DUF4129 domain-containing protein [Prevotella sp.]